MSEEKKRLRGQIRRRLAETGSLTDAYRSEAARRVAPRLLERTKGAQNILIYLSLADEFPTFSLAWPLYFGGPTPRNIVVPWCNGDALRLFNLLPADAPHPQRTAETFGERLEKGAFGIAEPLPNLRGLPNLQFDPRQLDLVIVPGRAFDRSGNRLGRGKGYYDRFLATLAPNCRLLALAFNAQMVESVPTEPHDRPMNAILTETDSILL